MLQDLFTNEPGETEKADPVALKDALARLLLRFAADAADGVRADTLGFLHLAHEDGAVRSRLAVGDDGRVDLTLWFESYDANGPA